MKKKLLFTFVSAAMVSFAAYSSLQSNEEVSLSELAMENAEALADNVNPDCPNGCLDIEDDYCFCYMPFQLKEAEWNTTPPLPPM